MTRRRGAIVALALLAGLAVYALAGRGSELSYGGAAAPHFSFRYDGMERVAPRGAELVRLEGRSGGVLERRLTVEPLALPGSPDPIATALPFLARRFERRGARRYPGYRQAIEGRTRLGIVDGRAAYMLGFTARGPGAPPEVVAGGSPRGSVWIGKVLMIPGRGDAPRRAVALELMERVRGGKVLAALRRAPAGFLGNWPVRFWVQQRTAVDAPTPLERPLRSFSLR